MFIIVSIHFVATNVDESIAQPCKKQPRGNKLFRKITLVSFNMSTFQ